MPNLRATQVAHHTLATIMQPEQLDPSTPHSTSKPTSPFRLIHCPTVPSFVCAPRSSPQRIVENTGSGTVDPRRLQLRIITTDTNETTAATHSLGTPLRTPSLGTTLRSTLGSHSLPTFETDTTPLDDVVYLVQAQDGSTLVGIHEDLPTSTVNVQYNFRTQQPSPEYTGVEGLPQPSGQTFTTLLLNTVGPRCVDTLKTFMAAEAVSVCLIAVAQYLHAGNRSCCCIADDYLDSEAFQLGVRQMLAGNSSDTTMTSAPPLFIQHQRTSTVLEHLRQWLAAWSCSETKWKPVAALDLRFSRATACIASSIRATGHSRSDVVGKWASETLFAPEAIPNPDRCARENTDGKCRSRSNSPTCSASGVGPAIPDHELASPHSHHEQGCGSVESRATRRSTRSSTSRSVDYDRNRHPQDEYIFGWGKRRCQDECKRGTKKAKLDDGVQLEK